MSVAGQKITIIGAGIGGLTAALCLQAQGAKVTVLEQAQAISEVGAGLQISPNGACVLRALGLGKQLQDISDRARAVVLKDYARAGSVLRLDLAQYAPDQTFGFVHRSDLINMLAQEVRARGVQVRLLQQVAEVLPCASPVIEMANGARLKPDLVIGADGLHSRARIALNGADAPFFTGQVAWRATVPNTFGLKDEATVYMGPGQHMVCYPLRKGSLVNIVAVQERDEWAGEGWHHADDPDNLRRAFASFKGVAHDILQSVDSVRLWGLFRHPVAGNWHRGRVGVMGDAAHPTLPFLAQGANLAMEDAWVLAQSLLAADTPEAGLAAYQNARHTRATQIIVAADGNAWKYHLRNPIVRRAAHLVLGAGGRIAPERMVKQFDWIYRHDVTEPV
ncbi:MAG: FAD-dependent monooxygenase [Paracoccaceae bacterium]